MISVSEKREGKISGMSEKYQNDVNQAHLNHYLKFLKDIFVSHQLCQGLDERCNLNGNKQQNKTVIRPRNDLVVEGALNNNNNNNKTVIKQSYENQFRFLINSVNFSRDCTMENNRNKRNQEYVVFVDGKEEGLSKFQTLTLNLCHNFERKSFRILSFTKKFLF